MLAKAKQAVAILGSRSNLGRSLPQTWASANSLTLLSSSDCDLASPDAPKILAQLIPHEAFILLFATVNKKDANDQTAFLKNTSIAENVAAAAIGTKAKGVIFTSTADLYGSAPILPITEASPLHPDSWYAKSKQASEDILLHELEGKCHIAIFRCPGLYNSSASESGVISEFAKKAAAGIPIELNNLGQNTRDLVQTNDLYSLFNEWMRAPKTGIWNVASGHSLPMKKIAERIIETQGSGSLQLRGSDQRNFDLSFDTIKLSNDFPKVRIRNFIEAYTSCEPLDPTSN